MEIQGTGRRLNLGRYSHRLCSHQFVQYRCAVAISLVLGCSVYVVHKHGVSIKAEHGRAESHERHQPHEAHHVISDLQRHFMHMAPLPPKPLRASSSTREESMPSTRVVAQGSPQFPQAPHVRSPRASPVQAVTQPELRDEQDAETMLNKALSSASNDATANANLNLETLQTASDTLGRQLAIKLRDRGIQAVRKAIALVSLVLLMGLGPGPLAVQSALASPDVLATPAAVVRTADTSLQSTAMAPKSVELTGQQLADSSAIAGTQSKGAPSSRYITFTGFPFPLGPFFERKTIETELVPGRVYGFEQQLKLSGITANVRSTVFRMRDGHLLVYNPVAPTEEFLSQLNSLNSKGVSHIMLGGTAYEHKVFVGPFARKFPNAKVWSVPCQWSWPLNLPAKDFGIDTEGTGGGDLIDTATGSAAYSKAPDLTAEFEVKLLRPPKRLGLGYSANEAALFHKDTKTLTLTDALINVPAKPTPIYDERTLMEIGDSTRDGKSLGSAILRIGALTNWQGTGDREINELFATANAQGSSSDQLQRGWERNSLFSTFFGPATHTLVDPNPSFQRIAGKWIVAPVTDSIIYKSKIVKPELKRWIEDVTKWDFKFISPSHFDARPGTPDDVRAAFAPAFSSDEPDKVAVARPFASDDVKLLDDIARALIDLKVI